MGREENINVFTIIEIAILSFLIYNFIGFLKNKKAYTLWKGIIIVGTFYVISRIFNFYVFIWAFENLFQLIIISIAVIFQPELRKALESIGQKKVGFSIFKFGNDIYDEKFSDKSIDEIIKAVNIMSQEKTGALILLEQNNSLIEYEQTGIYLNADISSQLLINIFEHNTPLHDGALIIKNNKITSATCYLPLSESTTVSKSLGTRHRAAIGASENVDALIIVVSEETGKISVAKNGNLEHGIDEDTLRQRLKESQQKVKTNKDSFFKKIKKAKKEEIVDEQN